jgi:hypothetical protein
MARNNQTHIKRDGQIFCLIDEDSYIKKILIKKYTNHISFSNAVKMKDTSWLCKKCQKKFYDKLSRMKNPIQVD